MKIPAMAAPTITITSRIGTLADFLQSYNAGMANAPVPPGSASVQAPLWGARVNDWAETQEPTARPLFESILAATEIGRAHV